MASSKEKSTAAGCLWSKLVFVTDVRIKKTVHVYAKSQVQNEEPMNELLGDDTTIGNLQRKNAEVKEKQ